MDKEKIACVVCNYNKKDYVLMCVSSLLDQTYTGIDVIVVDNASDDGSAEALRDNYGKKILVIENDENLGGSGGFNRGLRYVLEKDYKYVVLIDNDVRVAQDAIDIMYKYMESHTDVGILGAKILQMKHEDTVQDLGGSITDDFLMKGNFYGYIDKNLPDEMDCNYISTCTAMARVDAVRKFGLMPEDNFIYWDDVEWSKKCQLSGYRTVAIGNARVWHNHTITSGTSAFVKYYMTRNRLHFFAKYCEESSIENMATFFVEEVCERIMGFYLKGYPEMSQVIQQAFNDFLEINRGKCSGYEFPVVPERKIPLEQIVGKANSVKISFSYNADENTLEPFRVFLFLVGIFLKQKDFKSIMVDISETPYNEKIFWEKLDEVMRLERIDYKLPELRIVPPDASYDLHLKICNHVRKVKDNILPAVYVDGFGNCVYDERSRSLYGASEYIKELYHALYDEKTIKSFRKIKDAYNRLQKENMI